MNKLKNVGFAISKVAGRGGLVLKKYSPEILMVTGVVGVVTSTVLACKATLKLDDIVCDADDKIETIHDAFNGDIELKEGATYTEQDYKRDLVIAYVQKGAAIMKLYGPAVSLGVASIGCILGSHHIMSKRNVALVAAYKATEQAFEEYRKRVVDEYGEDKDHQFKYGTTKETITEVVKGEDGKDKKVKKTIEKNDPNMHSQYARFFDESSTQWSKTPEYNMVFLKCQQNFFNDMLNTRGHVFLNEVYDALGLPRSQAGAIVGWVKGQGDDYVDFGMYNPDSERARDFVNGYERSILLDFNVDGVIYDLI